jgi:hypothetical protein
MQIVCHECRAVAGTITREEFEAAHVPEELRSEELVTAQRPRCGKRCRGLPR